MNLTRKLSRLAPALAAAVFIGLAPAAAVAQTTAPATTDAPAAAAPAAPLRPPRPPLGEAGAARDSCVRGAPRRRS